MQGVYYAGNLSCRDSIMQGVYNAVSLSYRESIMKGVYHAGICHAGSLSCRCPKIIMLGVYQKFYVGNHESMVMEYVN